MCSTCPLTVPVGAESVCDVRVPACVRVRAQLTESRPWRCNEMVTYGFTIVEATLVTF